MHDAGVVDQDVDRAEPLVDRCRKAANESRLVTSSAAPSAPPACARRGRRRGRRPPRAPRGPPAHGSSRGRSRARLRSQRRRVGQSDAPSPRRRVPSRTGMDWEAEGLLEGLTDDAARDARRALLDKLHADGVPVEELRAGGRRAAARAAARRPPARLRGALHGARHRRADRGSTSTGSRPQRRALGLAVPDPDERVYGETDLESAKLGRQYREVGLPEEDAMEAQRVLGRGMARYAEAVRDLVGQTFLQAGTDEAELADRLELVAADPDAARRAVARVRLQPAHARGAAAGGRDRRAARHRADGRPRHRGRVRRPRRLHRAGGDDPVGGARQRRRAAVAAGRGGDRAPGQDRQGDRRRGDARLAGAGARWCESTLRLVEAPTAPRASRRSAPASPTARP